MPDEEMDMNVDFAHSGFTEDIDIELDFPPGQPDEEMDLGDFDQIDDLQNFNADTRDEMMAEGDDASYGMIDVEDTDHNASAAAANDIEIDIGSSAEGIWQQASIGPATFDADAEIDYLEEPVSSKPDLDTNVVEDVATIPQDTDVKDHAEHISNNVVRSNPKGQSEHKGDLDCKIDYQDSGISLGRAGSALGDLPHGPNDANQSLIAPTTEAATESSATNHDDGLQAVTNADELDVGQANQDGAASGGHVPGELERKQEESVQSEEISRLQPDQPIPVDVSNADKAGLNEEYQDGGDDFSELDEEHQFADDLDTLEYQLGDELYDEPANDQISGDNDAPAPDFPLDGAVGSDHDGTSSSPGLEDYNDDLAVTTMPRTSALDITNADSPIQLAEKYAMYISYGDTDYSIFAKSGDDDPNQYFLSDRSTLEVPLAQFLASLREIISEEISPLDELVMSVDGLGLEFSESTSQDFMSKFTFGDLLVLHDKLAQNEETDSLPDLYTYLTIKPNCSHRLMALVDSANAGRGLSELAMYRGPPSFVDDGSSEAGSLEADPLDNGGEAGDDQQAITYDEDEQHSHLSGDENEKEDESYLDHVLVATKSLDPLTNEATTGDDSNAVSNILDETTQIVDDQIDLSTEQQGICPDLLPPDPFGHKALSCMCDECYDMELRRIVMSSSSSPTVEGWPVPYPIRHSRQNTLSHVTNLTNQLALQDDNANTSYSLQSHRDGKAVQQQDISLNESADQKAESLRETTSSGRADAPNSENTSVTATLDGDNVDEIDYSDDEEVEDGGDADEVGGTKEVVEVASKLEVPVDDEITWESENEEAKIAPKTTSPKQTAQVSPVCGKRTRSNSDALESQGEENDVKRRRS
ncbi:hypothetical protein F5Y16DRAFT_415156 [Xylariaceae sp. FL0255]|nr:hypothetical protein F5Y16DRAFT_415156 [Xylariaceae sp. FL0255]